MQPYTISPAQAETRQLKKSSTFVAMTMLAMMFVDFLLTAASQFGLLQGVQLWANTHEKLMLVNMMIYVVCLAVPAVAVALIGGYRRNPFASKRVSGGVLGVGVVGGMAISIFANVAASWIMSWLTAFGVPEPEMPDMLQPTLISLALNIVATAVLPALIEEMIFRGYVLGILRPHGDGLAVVLSAVLFALFHGNVLQIPFAFILGLVLGYLMVQTDSIWPAVLLHFSNNLMSVLLNFFGKCFPGQEVVITTVTFVAVAAIGAVVLTVVCRLGYVKTVGNGVSLLTVRERAGKLLFSPAMVLALAALFLTVFSSMGSGL
ncbi:MAG: CPBP family intramembrane metalloprotease [Clostridia bacterium]|nr:CPBP family intramembrane metalloprotease [Clostridia bacterium]